MGRIYEILREKPIVFLLFTDPVLEQQYRDYARRSCRRGDVRLLCMSICILSIFVIKAEILNISAQLMRILAATSVVANLACLLTITAVPELHNDIRYPMINFMRIFSHIILLGFPSLLYGTYKTPLSELGMNAVGLLFKYPRLSKFADPFHFLICP
jgi:hypothetical protein